MYLGSCSDGQYLDIRTIANACYFGENIYIMEKDIPPECNRTQYRSHQA